MSEYAELVLNAAVKESGVMLVLPSEVAAASLQREAAEAAGGRALRSDLIVSWDVFKERCYRQVNEQRPINNLLRTVYSMDILARKPPFLDFLAPGDGPSPAFLPQLRRMLPTIPAASRVLARAADRSLEPLAESIEALLGDYSAFMAVRNLYEPMHEPIPPLRACGPVLIVFPELIDDFDQYLPSLQIEPRIGFLSAPPAPCARLLVFEREVHEHRHLMHELGRLLDEGRSPGDILVTWPGMDDSTVRELAYVSGVPLSIRRGRPLLEQPGAALFADLSACIAGGYHADDVKALLLNAAYPWKDLAANGRLVLFAARWGCIGDFQREGRRVSSWHEAVQAAEASSLGASFSRLAAACERIGRARTFSALLAAVMVFVEHYFDDAAWSADTHRVFNLAIDLLSELAGLEADMSLPPVDPFAAWLQLLRDRPYVAESEGIHVYPYKVAAGALPRHHFVVNLARGRTIVQRRPLDFLAEHLRTGLDAAGQDASAAFVAAYSVSGRSVAMSVARDGLDGAQLVPSYFAAQGLEEAAQRHDAWDAELGWWAGRAQQPLRLLSHQKAGLEAAAATAFSPRSVDYTSSKLQAGPILETVLERLSENGRLRMSDTRYRAYCACPFAYLLSEAFAVREEDWAPCFDRAATLGSLYHRVLYAALSAAKGAYGRGQAAVMMAAAAAALERDLDRRSWMDRPLPAPVLSLMKERITTVVEDFLREDAARFDGWAVASLERSIQHEHEGMIVCGRIDRILRSPEGETAVFDYKSGKLPAQKSICEALDPAIEYPQTIQLALYLWLLTRSGETPEPQAWYCGLQPLKHLCVRGPDKSVVAEDGEAQSFVAGAMAALERASRAIRSGMFTAAGEECAGCSQRGVCRTRYSLR